MDRKLTNIDFAAIGHQDSWDKIHDFVNSIRKNDLVPLTIEEIKDTYKYIPPRKIFDVEISSTNKKCKSRGIYIETFISPDELKVRHFKKCIDIARQRVLAINDFMPINPPAFFGQALPFLLVAKLQNSMCCKAGA